MMRTKGTGNRIEFSQDSPIRDPDMSSLKMPQPIARTQVHPDRGWTIIQTALITLTLVYAAFEDNVHGVLDKLCACGRFADQPKVVRH